MSDETLRSIDLTRLEKGRYQPADIDDPLRRVVPAERHLARVGHGIGEELDSKAGRDAELFDRRRRLCSAAEAARQRA